MRNLNVRQRIALAIGVAAVAFVIGRGIEMRFLYRGGWFGYAPNTSITVPAPYHRGDAILWTAWWVAVVVVTTVVVLAILRDPPPD